MGKERKREIWTILGKFGQVWEWGEKAERIRKGNKNLSGDGEEEEEEEEGGESRV